MVFTEIAKAVGRGDNAAANSELSREGVILRRSITQSFNYLIRIQLRIEFQLKGRGGKRWHWERYWEDRQQLQLHLSKMTISRFHVSRIFAILAGTAALASSAVAATLTISTNASSNGNGLGGGSYTISGSGLDTSAYAPISLVGAAGTFESFCLEYTEYFSPGSTYNYTVANAAVAGAGGAVGGQDPVSLGTAWLYSQFANGSLSGFDYGSGRKTSNNFLQLAFWFFEDETSSKTRLRAFPAMARAMDSETGMPFLMPR